MKPFTQALILLAAVALLMVQTSAGGAEETRGKVKAVQADNQTLLIRAADGTEQSFKIGVNVKVRIDDRDSILGELRQDDPVTIHWEHRDGAREITLIVLNRKNKG